ncbi:MAG: hypothetical protein ACI8P0_001730 [Planctomycetaceae bacterium]|jgi:hypothetical protein
MGDPSEPQTKKARQLRMNAASGPAGVVNAIGIEITNQAILGPSRFPLMRVITTVNLAGIPTPAVSPGELHSRGTT